MWIIEQTIYRTPDEWTLKRWFLINVPAWTPSVDSWGPTSNDVQKNLIVNFTSWIEICIKKELYNLVDYTFAFKEIPICLSLKIFCAV